MKLVACKLSYEISPDKKLTGRRNYKAGEIEDLTCYTSSLFMNYLLLGYLLEEQDYSEEGRKVLWNHISFRQLAAMSWLSCRVPAMNFVGVMYLAHT